ncbi:fuzzy planar cell polarity protein-like protein [Rhipicephalus microplus]|uniref:fuzzy planar cell polarity protein-like protein n=1 Tax=Rhipicephalus microplus TaxID=6941 RepID=UPI003F6BA586
MGKRPRSAIATAVPSAHAPARGPKMAGHLAALTADGGIPLLTRKIGDVKPLPFASVGTLNGVHLFSHLRGASLHSTTTKGAKVVWRSYHDSVVLLVVTNNDNSSDEHLNRLLDNVFAAMVMAVGLETLQTIHNVDRLKRELRVCYPMVDHLLCQLDQDACTLGDLTGVTDFILCTESQALQHYLDTFVEEVDSLYGCLLVRGKVAVATKQWMRLTREETTLLAIAARAGTRCISRETPVYLPTSCPLVSNRLVTLQLTQGVELCLLCGPAPSLAVLEEEVCRFWNEAFDLLKTAASVHPRNFPLSSTSDKKTVTLPSLDKNILGFLLVNMKKQRSLTSVHPVEDEIGRTKDGKCVSLRKRQEMLRALYKLVNSAYFTMTTTPVMEGTTGAAPNAGSSNHQVTEVYMCTETHKNYALRNNDYQLYILFSSSIPTFAMRSISHKTLKALTTNKVCVL